VRSTTEVEGLEPFNLVSVCIPWRDAHVRTGRKDRNMWDEHRDFLALLRDEVSEATSDAPTIVAGDFNQRLPRTRQPLDVYAALDEALTNLTTATAGDFDCGTLIDHLAATEDFLVTDIEAWSNRIEGARLSDHSGVIVTLIDAFGDDDPPGRTDGSSR
jgi:endonuclease/exonuclease/phosphatase (EEP) superfamily protein YafD